MDSGEFFLGSNFANFGEANFSKLYEGKQGILMVSLALIDDEKNVQHFVGELEGQVVLPRGQFGSCWE